MLKKNDKQLSVIQQKAIQMIITKDFTGKTIEDIANELNIDRSTIYKWQREDGHFITELNRQAELVMDAFVVECYDFLKGVIRDPKEQTKNKLSAVDKVMKLRMKYVDKIEIENKSNVTPAQQEHMRTRLFQLQTELLETGLVTKEQLEDISFLHSGSIENQLNELETIQLESELIE